MAQVINTNVASLNSQRNLDKSQGMLSTSLQRLSSGLRINSAKDDAAGLAISERFSSQIRGMDQARRNANDGISMAQTAEGALSSSGSILQRIRELAVQSANATNSSSDRTALQQEVSQLASELDRIAQTTEFNGQQLLNGTNSSVYQVGANANQTITSTTANFRTSAYGNYRIGSLVATATDSRGDLTAGSTAGALGSTATATSSRVAGGTLSIAGGSGSASVTIATGDSAKTAAGLVNAQTGNTGVTASARTELDLTLVAGSISLDITSNNTSAQRVSFTVSAATSDGLSGAINAINEQSGKTGVTAKLDSTNTKITLVNDSGQNITVAGVAGNAVSATLGTVAVASNGSAVATGQLTFDSDRSFSVTGSNATDFMAATGGTASQLQKVEQVDVSTVAGANRTIAIVDGALQATNGQRAKFGALQSRFENTISNLQTAGENMSASRSRIRDADFASETSNLTKAQVLQQAGTAMLAQANALPQQVLSLLRG
ncbi:MULTISPECIES: flagellin N-terminal helical domain-containing protein [Deefgea]|uniref:Flagellin n=1 Tax=Deefgea chitinilytica TaxID=570276 RepID=A0ABS2CBR3_9NEIS|nr:MULTISPECIES: flagellin [Deefgea]MBM5570878.1 flagellin [Deefgea chitinilytica]MBM9888107.1 flagellin [Deefgea sp. CFH1-16]